MKQTLRVLEIAAAGGHNVLMIGPPGASKTALARHMLSLLPSLTPDEALETARVYAAAELPRSSARPFRAPHYTISAPGLVGGGAKIPRPGEISLAHNGVLFLDALPEFGRQVLEAARQPLKDGHALLIAAMNPCPCRNPACSCSQQLIQLYRNRVWEGPLMDLFELHVEAPLLNRQEWATLCDGESSDGVKARVERARRTKHDNHKLNDECLKLLAMYAGARPYDRILRVSRTIADLAEEEAIRTEHVAEALQYHIGNM